MVLSVLKRAAAFAGQGNSMSSKGAIAAIAATCSRAAVAAAALVFAASVFAAVGVNKSFAPNSVTAGQVSTLTLVFVNPNAAAATAVGVTDTLPNNVFVAAPLTVGTNTCGFAVSATPGTQPIVLSGGTIPGISGGAPGQCTLTINVVSSLPNTYLNTIPANAIASSQGTNSQSTQATLVVSAPANITGSKAFAPANVHGNQTGQVSVSRLTITLTNPNSIPLTNAAITDPLPATITIATPANAATTCGAGTVTPSAPATSPATLALTGGTIPANGSCTFAVDVVARNPLIFQNTTSTNTIPANALTTAEGARSPAIAANIVVQTGAQITKSFAPNPIPPGGTTTSTMTLTINNWNATPLTPITFTDSWGAAMTVFGVPTTTCSGTLTNTANSVTLTGGTLAGAPAGATATSCTITVPVRATSSVTNSIAAGNFGGVAYPAVSSTLTVTPIGGSKSFTTPAFQTGTTTMTITLQNITAAPATITTITDNLTTMGTGFTIPAAAVPGGTCGSSLTSATPGTLITLSGGTIPANGTCTIILPVAIGANAATGTRTNTIAVNGVVTNIGNNIQAITGQVNVERALTMAKAFVPANVQAGTTSRLTVTLTRRALASALTNITFSDLLTTMGAGFVVATPANAATTCTGATLTAASGATSFSISGGSLAGGAAATACTVALDVATPPAGAPATYTNTIAANNVTTAEGVTNAAVTANLVLSPATSVTVNKSFTPTIVAVNGTSVMNIQVRNNNAGAINLTGVNFTDNLPAGMIVANPPAPTFTGTGCSIAGGSISAPNNATVVSVTNATVNANAICTLAVTVRATVSGYLINTLPPGGVTSAQGVTNPLLGSATLGATGTIKLAVTKTNGVTSVTPGGTTTYTIGVSNAGPNDVAGLVINDTPPAGVTFGTWTCVATGGATCGTGTGPISDTVTIPNGGSITYTVPATIAPGAVGSITNTVTAVVPGSVINTGGTTASDTDTLVPVTSLAITKDDGSTTYLPGGGATYLMVLTNGGPSDATSVSLTDTLPAGVVQNGGASCVATGAGAVCGTISNLGTGFSVAGAYVPAGGGANLAYSLPVTFGAGMTAPSITNTVNAANAASSGPGSTASASDTNTIILFGPTLGKSIAPATIAAGGTATLTLTLGNPNASAKTLTANFIDNMPAGVTTTGGNTGTCLGVSVTATQISMASGSSIPSGACTIIVTITSNTPGTVTNTTSTLQTSVGTAPAASAPLTVTASGPTLGKAISPASIAAGGTATLTLSLGNSNAAAATLTAPFTDAMPSGVTTTSANTGTCAGVVVTSGLISMPSGSTVPSGGCTIVVTITSSTAGLVTNTTSALQTGFGTAPAASAPLTVTVVAPTLGKSIAPATIAAGGTSTLTLTLGNPNAIPITLGADFTDSMPAGVTTTSANTGTCAAVAVTPTLVKLASGATIPAGGCTIIVTITSTTAGTVTNTTSTLQTGSGTAPAASAPLTVTILAPTLGKSIAPATIAAGGTSTLTLTLGNPNAIAITLGADFTDAMPAGVTTTSANTGTCPGVVVTPTLITLANGAAIPSGGCTIIVTITSTTAGTVTNTTSTLQTGSGTAAAASAPLTVTVLPPTLAKAITPGTIAAGGSATLTLTLGNPNAIPIALGADFTDPMPAGVTTTSANTGTCTGVVVTPTLITLANGAALPVGGCTIVVTITSTTAGTVTNTTSTLQTGTGTAPAASAPLTVTVLAPTLAKAIAPATINAGGTATLTLTLGNPNAIPITLGADFTDPMPAGVTTTSANTGTCSGVVVASALITLANGATLPVGGCTIVVTVTSSTPGLVTNTTSTLQTGTGTAPAASAPLTVTAVPVTLAKSIAPATITATGTATLTLTLGNTNATPQPLTAVFTDTMPAGVTTTSANTGTCTGVTVTASSISMASGTNVPPGGCTIIVTITSATPGTVTNTTSTLATGAGVTPAASAPLTVSEAAATLLKSILPATIVSGGPSTLTITIGNVNATASTLGAPFTDTMPAGVTTTSANTGTCTPVAVTSTLITLPSGSTIPVGGCTIVVTVTSFTPGTVTNTTSTLVTGGGTTPAASAPLTVTASASTLGKTILPSSIVAGASATLTISLSNANTTPLILTAPFTDAMPTGVTTTSAATGTCTGVTVAPALITVAAGTSIPPGGCTIVVTITSATPGTVTNTTSSMTTGGGTSPPASAPLTVTPAVAGLTKAIAPATIPLGGSATLTLTLTNINTTPLTLTAAFTDPMPAGVTTTSGNTGTCAGVTVGAALITMASGSTIPPGGCTIVVTITSSTPGAVTNTTSTLVTGAGTTPAASAPLTVTATASSLTKTILPATIGPGGTATLTLTLGNSNPGVLTLAAPFTDIMPAGVGITSTNTGTCTGVTVNVLSLTKAAGSTVPVGGCTIIVTISSSTPGTVVNTTSTLVTQVGTTPAASAPLTVTGGTAATLTKTIAPGTIAPGGTATLTLALGNPNATPLTLTAPFTDAMPAGVTTTSANTGTCAGVTVTPASITMASGAVIPPGGCSIVVTITSSTPGTVTNITSALQTGAGTTPAANAPLTVTAGAGPTLVKTIAPATIAAGGASTLTLSLGNPNATPITLTAAFTDAMPAGVTTTSGNTGTCSGVTVTSTLVTMASGASIPPGGCTIVVAITSSTPGTVINTTGTLQTSAGVGPAASAPLTVTAAGGPVLNKAIVPGTIAPGGTATLTLTLGNPTAAPLTLTAPFTDAMPAGVTTTSANTGTCAGVTVTATLITMASGAAIPPGGCTIVVTITSSTPGAVVNTTSALQTSAGTSPPASAPLAVVAGAVTLNKTFVPGTIVVGTNATLTLALGNTGLAPVVLTAPFADPMPAGLTITSPNTGTCVGVTVTPTLITVAAGATIPPGGCTIVVGVSASAEGSYVNVTGPLATSGGSAPPATAPVNAVPKPPVSAEPIPTHSPLGLALMLLAIALVAGRQFRTDRRVTERARHLH